MKWLPPFLLDAENYSDETEMKNAEDEFHNFRRKTFCVEKSWPKCRNKLSPSKKNLVADAADSKELYYTIDAAYYGHPRQDAHVRIRPIRVSLITEHPQNLYM